MKKVFIAMLTFFGASFLLGTSSLLLLEHNRVSQLCQHSHHRVETSHDAINAIRNYNGNPDSDLVGRVLSKVRQSEAFQNDGYETTFKNEGGRRYKMGGGWTVEERVEPMVARVYSVKFEYSDISLRSGVEVTCDVFDCGAIDLPNCMTLGY